MKKILDVLGFKSVSALRKAVIEGDTDNGSLMAGQISGMVSKIQSVNEIIKEMFNEYEDIKVSFNS